MKKAISCGLAAVLLTGVAALSACKEAVDIEASAFSSPDMQLTVDATSKTEISDELFGLFLEDINYATYAMDAQLLENGSFESTNGDLLAGWTAEGGASVQTLTDPQGIPSGSPNKHYLHLSTGTAGGVSNSGYTAYPLAVTEGGEYLFSAFFKGEGSVTLRLSDATATYAEKTISLTHESEWVKYTTSLTASGASTRAKLEILLAENSELDLDAVSLTTRDETVGVKNYFYQAIADLSPAFLRFPGGCVIEGKNDLSAYDWKNSIGVNSDGKATVLTYIQNVDGTESEVTTTGEPSTRTPNQNIWKQGDYYDMEYTLGFYEYFLLCDSLGASAIPIVNCGLSCMIQTNGYGVYNTLTGRNGNGVADYIQDALDLVAFAKGSVTSSDANEAYWAQVRTDMGHAEPFKMTYLGIGNEQFGLGYYQVYEQFLEAFNAAKEKNPSLYGDIQLIVGNGVSFNDIERSESGGTAKTAARNYRSGGKITTLAEYGVQDHHYYMSYADFLSNTKVYDSYTRGGRNGYEVFVGEYSANTLTAAGYETKGNSWITALSEAAYMTGLERNGDVVKLAAYAPMFGNLNAGSNQWAVDMMYYDNSKLLLSANYYVQQLFAKNSGTAVLATTAEKGSSYETTMKLSKSTSLSVEKLYQTVCYDEETGDIIVKLVNISDEDVTVNVSLSGAKLTGVAHATALSCSDKEAVNTTSDTAVSTASYSLGVKKKFGVTARANSVTAIRVHTK